MLGEVSGGVAGMQMGFIVRKGGDAHGVGDSWGVGP